MKKIILKISIVILGLSLIGISYYFIDNGYFWQNIASIEYTNTQKALDAIISQQNKLIESIYIECLDRKPTESELLKYKTSTEYSIRKNICTTEKLSTIPTEDNRICRIVIADGYGSKGEFSNAVIKVIDLAKETFNKKAIKTVVVPQNNYAENAAKNIINALTKINNEVNQKTKVLVATHSIASIGVYNRKLDTSNSNIKINYLLYDPPYMAASIRTPSVFTKLFPNVWYLGQLANGAQIKIARVNGIATSSETISWTDGLPLRQKLFPSNDDKKYNEKLLADHELFASTTVPLRQTFGRVFSWVKNNCPDNICLGFTYSPWTPDVCPASGKQTRTVTSSLPTGCTDNTTHKLTRTCTYVPPPKCNFTYSEWTPENCTYHDTQTRKVIGKYPVGCEGGTVGKLSQSCDKCNYNCYPPTFTPWSACSATAAQPIGYRNRMSSCSCVPYEELYEQCTYVPPHAKPVIYLYPTQAQEINVQLDYDGNIIADYPSYDKNIKGWQVTASPDGKIINSDGKEYSYIFWEGTPAKDIKYDNTKGFVVKGEDVKEFLQKKLAEIGLTPKEYNEFIVYWYPKMKDNKYNLIHFADEEYTDIAPLTITPKPDSMLRVFMVYKPLKNEVEIEPQIFPKFERRGFTVVEWGGSEIK